LKVVEENKQSITIMGTEAIQRMGTGKIDSELFEEKPLKSCDFINTEFCCSILHQLPNYISIQKPPKTSETPEIHVILKFKPLSNLLTKKQSRQTIIRCTRDVEKHRKSNNKLAYFANKERRGKIEF
jgi:hypothetical protein